MTAKSHTLDTLRALNPLYDHEHSLTQKNAETVDTMK